MRATLIYNDATTNRVVHRCRRYGTKAFTRKRSARHTSQRCFSERVDFREPPALRQIDNNIIRLRFFRAKNPTQLPARARARVHDRRAANSKFNVLDTKNEKQSRNFSSALVLKIPEGPSENCLKHDIMQGVALLVDTNGHLVIFSILSFITLSLLASL